MFPPISCLQDRLHLGGCGSLECPLRTFTSRSRVFAELTSGNAAVNSLLTAAAADPTQRRGSYVNATLLADFSASILTLRLHVRHVCTCTVGHRTCHLHVVKHGPRVANPICAHKKLSCIAIAQCVRHVERLCAAWARSAPFF